MKDRDLLILRLRDVEGKTFREIAEAHNVGVERARQLYARAVRRRDYERDAANIWHYPLSVRAVNVLVNADISTKQEAVEAIRSGQLHRYRGCGWKVYCEVAQWAGLPKPERRSGKAKTCPHCGGVIP